MIKKILIGLIAGVISGYFSTGGGMILVPAFIYILKKEPTIARATSVFCILPMVLASSFFYYRNDYIDWNLSVMCAIGGAIGGYLGAKLLGKIPEYILKVLFIVFLIYASYNFIW